VNNKAFLDNIYQTAAGDPMRQAYDQWADSYDADIEQQQYCTPGRVAAALARHLQDKAPRYLILHVAQDCLGRRCITRALVASTASTFLKKCSAKPETKASTAA